MNTTTEVTSAARSKISELIGKLLGAYHAAETPQSQRDYLLQLRAINEAIALTEPITGFGQFTELQVLDVTESELVRLLSGYRANLTRPDGKVYLARIQNCVLRARVIDRESGAERVLGLMSDLQRDSDHRLVLM